MKGDLIMKETRELNGGKVRAACIRYNLYTAGDCEEYDTMFDFIRTLTTATTDDLETVATDIKEHSDTKYEIVDIMFILANECCTTFFD